MDRQIVYAGQIPLDTDVLNTNRNTLIGLGLLAQDILGTGTCVSGLPCTQTTVPSLAVLVGPGRIYSSQTVDATPYGSLLADTVDLILKQGIQLGNVTLATPAPTTNGFSINYLIQAAYQDADASPTVLAYYNAANPAQALIGPLGSGAAQNTQRQGTLVLQAKAGVPAATGTQATPAADAAFVGLYVITVAKGQATVTAANIAQFGGAPFIGLALGTRTVSGAQAQTALTINSGNSGTTATADVNVRRAGSRANTVATGPSLELLDSSSLNASIFQNSGGQTEFWQFNSITGWQQWMKVGTNLAVTINAPTNGTALSINALPTQRALQLFPGDSASVGMEITDPGLNNTALRLQTSNTGTRIQSLGTSTTCTFSMQGGDAITIAADRGIFTFGAGGGSQGVGTINATEYFRNGNNLVTLIEIFANTAAATAQANAIASANGFATAAANAAQAAAIAAAETYANGTATAEGWAAPGGGEIIKSGVATMIASAPGTLINFATPFPNACTSVVIVAFGANATSTVLDKSKTGFHGINGIGGQCCWIAVGT